MTELLAFIERNLCWSGCVIFLLLCCLPTFRVNYTSDKKDKE